MSSDRRSAALRARSREDEVHEVGARLSKRPARELLETAYGSELEAQRAFAHEIGLADLAHTIVLVERGIIPARAGHELVRALLDLQRLQGRVESRPELGDLHMNREAWLAARTDAAGWLGAGRARREATTTAWQMVVRDRLLELGDALVQCGVTLVGRATGLEDALVPDYTYLQPGQPTSAAHYLLAFAYPMVRDLDRLRGLLSRVDRSPAGCGSANGSRLGHDRARLAALLAFPRLAVHGRDAMWQPDLPIESLSVATAALVNADRLAEDLMFFCSPGTGVFELSDAHCRASKILPQKRNPYALAHIRGVANRLIGVQATVASAGRSPSGQLDSRSVPYAEVPRALADAAAAICLLEDVLADVRFDAGAAAVQLARSFVGATDLAEVIMVDGGIDHRSAQRVVGFLAREKVEAGEPYGSIGPADVAAAAAQVLGAPVRVPAEAIAAALDPAQAVAARTDAGGAAPEAVEVMAAECRDALVAHAEALATQRTRIASAERTLLEAAEALRGTP